MSGTPNAPEFRIQIDRSSAAPPANGATSRITGARKTNEGVADEIKRRRAKIHEQHQKEAGGKETAQAEAQAAVDADPPPVREPIEEITFTAPNGIEISYGPPNNISVVDRIARMYPGRDTSMAEFRLTRILLGIRSIDGKPVAPIVDDIGRTALANRIGDETIDLIMYFDRIHFPPLRQSEIPVIQKKYKT